MTASGLAVGLLWAVAAVVVLAAVGLLAIRRTAGRVALAAGSLLVALMLWGLHLQVAAIASDNLPALCSGGAQWFGLELHASQSDCG